jgi:hypothetical protein
MDASGAALPGVTVVASCPQAGDIFTTVTDGRGEYLLEGLPAGSCAVGFHLDGFEASAVSAVAVRADHTAVLNHALSLASLAETVDVVARRPPEPEPPPQPLVAPVTAPLPDHDVVTVCGPSKADSRDTALAHVAASRFDDRRLIYAKGDLLVIDAGTAQGVRAGENLAVRRQYKTGVLNAATKANYTGEHTAGVVQVVTVRDNSADAVVVYACDAIIQGDFVTTFAPQIVPPLKPRGTPDFQMAGRILFGDEGESIGAPDRMLVVDRGSSQGAAVGERLTVFRRHHQERYRLNRKGAPERTDWPTQEVGEAVVVAVRADSSTIRVLHSIDAIYFGDQVAPHR